MVRIEKTAPALVETPRQIETSRLILRPWKKNKADAKALYSLAKDERIGPAAGWGVHKDPADSLRIIREILSTPDIYAVTLKEGASETKEEKDRNTPGWLRDGNAGAGPVPAGQAASARQRHGGNTHLIGAAGITYGATGRRWLGEKEGEIGYWIGVPFWGNGYAPEAVQALLRRAFFDLKMEAVWCGFYEGNEKSLRVQEKCGFVYDHTDRHSFCEALGEERVEHFTRLTRERYFLLSGAGRAAHS